MKKRVEKDLHSAFSKDEEIDDTVVGIEAFKDEHASSDDDAYPGLTEEQLNAEQEYSDIDYEIASKMEFIYTRGQLYSFILSQKGRQS